ncbi:LamG domain-containing protein [Candidatus Woesearchaeota archaeon]|nr:LamG domain-containing protein [Candidatus Woesearchaeota archaeon]
MKKEVTYKACSRKAQAGFEFLILIGLFLVILGIVLVYSTSQLSSYIRDSEIGDMVLTLSNTVNHVSAIGPGSAKVINIKNPDGIDQGYTAIKEIIVKRTDKGKLSDIHFPTNAPVFGLLEPARGNRYMLIKTEENGYVSISPLGYPNLWSQIKMYMNLEIKNSTHIYDASGYQNFTIMNNSIDCTNQGYIGLGCDFDGVDDFLEVPYNESFDARQNSVSWGVWMYLNQTSGTYDILSQNDSTDADSNYNFWGILVDDNNIICMLRDPTDTNAQQLSSGTIDQNIWYNVFCVRDFESMEFRMYVDGNLADSDTLTEDDYMYSDRNVYIGTPAVISPNDPVNGTIDEIMFFNRSLNDEEADKFYKLGKKN